MNSHSRQKTHFHNVIRRRDTREDLARRGVFTLEQLTQLNVTQLSEVHGISLKSAPRIHALARAFHTGQPVWIQPIPDRYREDGLILDIRVNPDTYPQMPWGLCWRESQDQYQMALVHPRLRQAFPLQAGWQLQFVPGHPMAWQSLADHVEQRDGPLYYWGKQILKHIHMTAPAPLQARLQPYLVDLHRIFLDTVALPVKTTGLQPVANRLGYTWQGARAPYEAHIDYLFWLREDRIDLLRRACHYMVQNVEAVAAIRRWLLTQAPA